MATSSYRNTYVIGKSLNIASGYKIMGVDLQTGIYNFSDSAGKISSIPSFRIVDFVNFDPQYYGGINNEIAYKQWMLSFFFEYRKQMGYSLGQYASSIMPGQRRNQPAEFVDAWHQPGDVAQYQKYTQSTTGDAYKAAIAIYNNNASGAYSTDASFIRLKNIFLSYSAAPPLLKKLQLSRLNVFVQGQNLWLITKYIGNDPEIQLPSILPPLKSLVAGIQLSL